MKSPFYILRSNFVLIILLLAGSAKLYAQHIDILRDPVPHFDYEGYMAKWQDNTLTDEVRLEAFFTLLFQHNEYGKGPPPSIYVDVWREDIDKPRALESKY